MYIRNINFSGIFTYLPQKSLVSIKDTITSCRNKDNINSVKEKSNFISCDIAATYIKVIHLR